MIRNHRRGRPAPPEERSCPVCGALEPPVETTVTFKGPNGGVEGDLICGECGGTIDTGVLFREPERHRRTV